MINQKNSQPSQGDDNAVRVSVPHTFNAATAAETINKLLVARLIETKVHQDEAAALTYDVAALNHLLMNIQILKGGANV